MANRFLDTTIEKIRILDNPVRDKYYDALLESLKVDTNVVGNGKPKCKNPNDLYRKFSFGLDSLLSYRIILDLDNSVQFLNSIGNDITYFSFRGKYNRKFFEEFFGYEVVTLSGKNKGVAVYTYSQVMHLAQHLVNLELPKTLS